MYTAYASSTPGYMQTTGTQCHIGLKLVEILTLFLLLSMKFLL